MQNELYQGLRTEAKKIGETNDCGVKALAVITGLPYEVCHQTLKSLGRKDRKGTFNWQMWKALDILGFCYQKIECPFNGLRSLGRNLPDNGAFLIHATKHYVGAKDGQIHDWSEGRCLRIQGVYQIFKKGEVQNIHVFKTPEKTGRTRQTRILYKLVHRNSGRVVANYMRYPTKIQKVISYNGIIRINQREYFGSEFFLIDA
jgi:hypothetical protein